MPGVVKTIPGAFPRTQVQYLLQAFGPRIAGLLLSGGGRATLEGQKRPSYRDTIERGGSLLHGEEGVGSSLHGGGGDGS